MGIPIILPRLTELFISTDYEAALLYLLPIKTSNQESHKVD
jgi:hypothetical protein